MTDRPSVTGAMARADSAHQKIEDHERLCAERYANINAHLGELKDGAKTQSRLVIGVLLALLGWMAVQLWDGQAQRFQAPPARTAP
jgi:hypothetical protein